MAAAPHLARPIRHRLASLGTATVIGAVSLALLATGAGAASAASAHPTVTATSASTAGDIAVSLNEMGLGTQVAFTGLTSEQDLTLPVPDGMHPQALTGTLVLPADIDSGWIEVITGNTRVDLVRFDATSSSAGIALSIPLNAVPVSNRAASLRLVAHLIPADPTCYDRSLSYPLTLTSPTVHYSGTDTYAQTVADFLPPILRSVTIDVRGAQTADVRQAVLTLSARLVQRYSSEPTTVTIDSLGAGAGAVPAGSSAPLTRTIVLDASASAADAIVQTSARPALLIGGAGGSLADQVAGLTSDLSQVAQASSATFAGAQMPVTLEPAVQSFTDLGIGNLTSTGAGTVAVSFGLDQARLGGRASSLGFDLRATYTPLPSTVGGLITFAANGTQIASWETQRNGQLREHVDVPASDLTRYTTFTLGLSLTGNTGECGTQLVDTLTIDPSSTVTTTLATSGLVGFQSLPQALVPTFDVVISGDDLTSLVRTASIVDGLQRETSVPLSPQLVTTSVAESASLPALFVYPTADAPKTFDLPLQHVDTSKYVAVPPAGTTGGGSVTANVQLGCIQVAQDTVHKRVIVVASSPDGTGVLLDKILTWLNADPNRWFGLTGNVLAAAPSGDPFTLSVGVAKADTSGSSLSTAAIIGVCVGIVVVLGLLVLGVALRRRRRNARSGTDPGAEDGQ